MRRAISRQFPPKSTEQVPDAKRHSIAFIVLTVLCIISVDGSNHTKFLQITFSTILVLCVYMQDMHTHCDTYIVHVPVTVYVVKTSKRTSTIVVLQVLSGIR